MRKLKMIVEDATCVTAFFVLAALVVFRLQTFLFLRRGKTRRASCK